MLTLRACQENLGKTRVRPTWKGIWLIETCVQKVNGYSTNIYYSWDRVQDSPEFKTKQMAITAWDTMSQQMEILSA